MRFTYSNQLYGTRVFDQPVSEILIGRPNSEHIVDLDLTPDLAVSRLHARLFEWDGSYWIEDLNSKHGTWVDGQRITEKKQLSPESRIQVGQTSIVLRSDDVAAEEAVREAPVDTARISKDSARLRPSHPTADLGKIRFRVDVTHSLFAPSKTDEGTVPADNREQKLLQMFYDFTQVLGSLGKPDLFMTVLVGQIQKALPDAQSGAILMRDSQGKMVVKEHWPAQHSPAVNMILVERARSERVAFIWTVAGQEYMPPMAEHMPQHQPQAALYAPLYCEDQVYGMFYVGNYKQADAFAMMDCHLLCAFANQTALFIKNQIVQQDIQREAVMRTHLLRHFPRKMVERFMNHNPLLQAGGERRAPVTILQSDVRGFSELSAMIKSPIVMQMLNDVYEAFAPIIFHYGGTIGKHSGETLLAVFGSLEPDSQQWTKAVRAALEMQHAMKELAETWQKRDLPALAVGIGLDTGEVIHGFIGSTSEQIEYAVMGDTVNQVKRYCGAAGQDEIVISRAMYDRVSHLIEAEPKQARMRQDEASGGIEQPEGAMYSIRGMVGVRAEEARSG